MNFDQIGIFFLQGAIVSLLILFLFNFRRKLGLGILFACLGLFQFMQAFLTSTVYVEIADNIIVSPGSCVLFTATLFAILIIYIKEDASATRKIIYALLIANIVMSFLITSFGWNMTESYDPENVSVKFFNINSWVLLIGTLVLFIDSILIIIFYELVSKYTKKLFFRICLTMMIVVFLDTTLFSFLAFWESQDLVNIYKSALISKGFFTIFYSFIFGIYLKYFDLRYSNSENLKINDIFRPLTYRQKYEIANLNAIKSFKEVQLKENKYQILTNTSPVGIFNTSADGITTFVNPKWCEITGIPMNEALKDKWLEAIHPDDREQIKNEFKSTISEKRKSQGEFRFLLSDGSIKWVLSSLVPEHNDKKEVIGYTGTITDISDLKKYQEEQIKLRQKAEESDRLKTAFLCNMSHEIRTPMNGILGFMELIKEHDLDYAERNNFIEIVNQSGERLLNTINDIIEISKIESGDLPIHISIVDLPPILNFHHEFFKTQADNKGLELILKDSEELVIEFQCDSNILNNIFTNLIKNAIKFTDKGIISFGYSLKENEIEFFVKDTGIGIPKDKQEAIFDRFIQADNEDKRAFQGSGLGLAIVKANIEALDGKIWIESTEDKGSTFFFTFPYQNKNYKNPELEIKLIDEDKKNKPQKKLKVVIAEDDKVSSLFLETILKLYNYDIIKAKNGKEAVDICKKTSEIDVVLMDINMPVMDGYKATRKIREFNTEIIIIAQTGNALPATKEKTIDAGCNDFITKPINKIELQAKIHKHFEE